MVETSTGIHIPKPPELPKPERLSDEKIGNLLSSVGNNEVKAITLILMRSGDVYDKGSLHRQVLNAQGEKSGWEMAKGVLLDYCSYTLAPIGLVAKEAFGPDLATFGYSITDYGKALGIPLAGLLLDFSERHNISLNKLFGSTVSNSKGKTMKADDSEEEFKKRAPTTTLKILFETLTSPQLPIREADIVKRIGEDDFQVVNNNLVRLAKLGLIEYSSTEVNEPFSAYKIPSEIPTGEFPMHSRYPRMTKLIFDILNEHPNQYLTITDVFNLIPQNLKSEWKAENHSEISDILSFLARQKYLYIKKFNFDKRSGISITDEQKIILTELLEIVYGFQNQDKEILEKGRKLAIEIISNPDRVSNLMRRAREASNQANQSPMKETLESVQSLILANPGVTNRKIRILLEEKYQRKLGISSIRNFSSSLVEQGLVIEKKQGNLSRFFPKEGIAN